MEVGSQAEAAVFAKVDAKHPGGFDIVLDDGSHDADHMIATFSHAWQLLRPGGVYFIEDITKENVRALEDIVLSAQHPYAGSVRAGHSIVKAMYDNPGASCCDFEPNQVQREVEYVKMYPMLLAIKKVVLANPNPTVTLTLTLTPTLRNPDPNPDPSPNQNPNPTPTPNPNSARARSRG